VQGRKRPADMMILKCVHDRDVAIDPTVVHPLNPSHPWDSREQAVDRALKH